MLLIILIILIILLHFFGIQGLYYSLPYYDKALHLLGGIIVGLIGLKFFKFINLKYSLIKLLIFSFLIGLVWELHEYVWDIFLTPRFNLPVLQLGTLDTLTDLLFDLVGALIIAILLAVKVKISSDKCD